MTAATRLRLALIAEDADVASLVTALVRRVAAERGVVLDWLSTRLTHGCRVRPLKEAFREFASHCDLVVVAADASGRDHGRPRRGAFRPKARALQAQLSSTPSRQVVFAVAEPSSEAWLLAFRAGLTRTLSAQLGVPFANPREWPRPRTERDAKDALGRIVAEGVGGSLPRGGFEFADEIVADADLEAAESKSLAAFLADLRSALGR